MNGIIVIDKPAGWTSFDVIAKLRGILKEKRIGHSGTLDPMATGVLPVFIGRATRAVEFVESDSKIYVAGLRLGIVTDTQDTTGSILSVSDVSVSEQAVAGAVLKFTGVQEQLPPMYSAIKIGGQKLYELARRGIDADRKPRRITIDAIEILKHKDNDYLLRVACSKGTYIRTLCHDIGGSLGCGGTMASLRREQAGSFTLKDAVSLEDTDAAMMAGRINDLLRPVDAVFDQYPAITIDARQKAKCLNGAEFAYDTSDGLTRVYDEDTNFLMLGRAVSGTIVTVKSFFTI
jgi:tRNA pseudouridine55 synthase